MFALYCLDPIVGARVRAALAHKVDLLAAGDWECFEREVPRSACALVFLRWLGEDAAGARLAALRRRLPLQPLVLMTSRDADNLRLLGGTQVDEIVWMAEIERSLAGAVRRAQTHGLLSRVSRAVAEAPRITEVLREAFALMCRADRPPRTVAALAMAVGCDRRTLWRHWRAACSAPEPRLEDALHWLLLLTAASRKLPSQSWAAVAEELGVHEHTLARSAGRLTGLSLRQIAAADHLMLPALFAQRVLRPLVGGDAWDILR